MKYSKETLRNTFQDELKDPVTAQVRRDNINIVAFNKATKDGERKKERKKEREMVRERDTI
jgi:hypothetical protein